MEPKPHTEHVFNYRYVPYGTRFVRAAEQERHDDEGDDDRKRLLFDNELAVDVGGVCWGYNHVTESVLDHHFLRHDGGQFPSAAAAVLHRAHDIAQRFSGRRGRIWLVSHVSPDFDAFCAMFLARQIISGELASDGWEELGLHRDGWCVKQSAKDHRREIDWFQPRTVDYPEDRRWAVLLAAYAACVDNCRRLACPKTRALHAVLYAALVRGRNYLSQTSGALEFFSAVRHELQAKNLNPLFDSVLEGNHVFDRELRMLDHEVDAYQRDLRRARRAIVFVQQAETPAHEWGPDVCQRPLIEARDDRGDKLTIAAVHTRPARCDLTPVDGIYLRDPECLLFKEWARYDVDNSFFRQGFLFTAVAYSGGRSSRYNNSEYFFALDPERAGNRHLYNVWARLQAAECEALLARERHGIEKVGHTKPRPGFEGRANDHWRLWGTGAEDEPSLFSDPWFDGSNYDFTLIATPNRGSFIGQPKGNADLLDDPVVQVVREDLELAIFESEVHCLELPSEPGETDRTLKPFDISQLDEYPPHREHHYYSYDVRVSQEVDLLNRALADQIGHTLWRVLEGMHGAVVPDDFHERHLLGGADWIGVWSRRGVAVASKPEMGERVIHHHSLFKELVGLSREAGALSRSESATVGGASGSVQGHRRSEDLLAEGAKLTRRVAHVKRRLAFPEARLLGRFFEASRLDEVLTAIHDLNVVTSEADHRGRIEELTKHSQQLQVNVEWLEIFVVGFYAFELADRLVTLLLPNKWDKAGAVISLVVGVAFGAGLFLWLRPDRHSSSEKE